MFRCQTNLLKGLIYRCDMVRFILAQFFIATVWRVYYWGGIKQWLKRGPLAYYYTCPGERLWLGL